MQTIIQLSDFHIKMSMGKPEKNQTFTSLINALKKLHLCEPILVYNGDVIDSNVIRTTIDDSLSSTEKATLWNTQAHDAYALAEEYFQLLTSELNISNDRIIICCGNHDVNTYEDFTTSMHCPGSSSEVLYTEQRFKEFKFFCNRILLRKNVESTYYQKINDISFLVVNTNWRNKWSSASTQQKLCIACDDVKEVIQSEIKQLECTKRDKSKTFNVYVAHAPSTDYCEEALFAYPENNFDYVYREIDRMFGLKLYGDKHTNSVHSFDYIVGAPLDSDYISCGIHEFDDANHHHHYSLVYSDGEWKVIGSEDHINQILEVSKSAIKTQALEYLFGSRDTSNLEQKIIEFETVRAGDKWNALDRLLQASADIQQPQRVGAGTPVSANDGFINTLTRLIADSHSKVAITLRGEPRLGKSVCLSALYMNLLHRFICGTFEYLPVYINVEHLYQQENSTKKPSTNQLYKKICDDFTKKYKDGIELAERLQRPACCIIDGLNKYYLFGYPRIEDFISSVIDSSATNGYRRLVYCIDVGLSCGLGSTPQDRKKDADHLVYFNRLKTQKANSNKKYESFVRAFCELRNNTQCAERVLTNIERMQIAEVDTGLLINFWDQLCIDNEATTYFQAVDNYVMRKIASSKLKKAAQMAYLYCHKKDYSVIKLSTGIFELIRTQQTLTKYLLAVNYVFHIQDDDFNNECLDELYTHEITVLIREYICKCDLQESILKFAEMNYERLSYKGIAMLVFLLGRLNYETERVNTLLAKAEVTLTKANKDLSSKFYRHVALRSVEISKCFICSDSSEAVRRYICKLISNEYDREVNRMFYLQFYGDRPFDDAIEIKEGFDIYCTYNLLASRLKKWKDQENSYTLMELELFTLCDLIQVRLDNPIALSSNGKDELLSFFYNKKYNNPNDDMALHILTFMESIIDQYIDIYRNARNNTIFIQFLSIELSYFKAASSQLASHPLKKEENRYKPEQVFADLTRIEQVPRIGWYIQDIPEKPILEADFKRLSEQEMPVETTLIHTYEAYLIGLLYLPAELTSNPSYCKQKILNLILVHDLGESVVGDIVPMYEHYNECRAKEKEFCDSLFLQGIHKGIADLSEYFYMWQEWHENSTVDINVIIAREIDKIQMLHKLLHLLKLNRINLSAERVRDFWKTRNSIQSNEGKRIFNILIAREEFSVISQANGITITPLK